MFQRIKRAIICLMYIGFAVGILSNPTSLLLVHVVETTGIPVNAWVGIFAISALAMLTGAILKHTVLLIFYTPLFIFGTMGAHLSIAASGVLTAGTVIFLSLVSYILVDYAGELTNKWISRKL